VRVLPIPYKKKIFFVLGHEVGNDEGHVAESIVVVELENVFDVRLDARDHPSF